MKTYTVGAKLFCDFHFGGKPEAVCIEVIEPGTGKHSDGKIRVRLTETVGGYNKGELLELNAFQAVPIRQKLPIRSGQFFTRIDTNYEWIKP